MAVYSLTALPEVVLPKRKDNPLLKRFLGLSLDRNNPLNMFIGFTSNIFTKKSLTNYFTGVILDM